FSLVRHVAFDPQEVSERGSTVGVIVDDETFAHVESALSVWPPTQWNRRLVTWIATKSYVRRAASSDSRRRPRGLSTHDRATVKRTKRATSPNATTHRRLRGSRRSSVFVVVGAIEIDLRLNVYCAMVSFTEIEIARA